MFNLNARIFRFKVISKPPNMETPLRWDNTCNCVDLCHNLFRMHCQQWQFFLLYNFILIFVYLMMRGLKLIIYLLDFIRDSSFTVTPHQV